LTTKWEETRAIGFEDFVTSLRKVRPSVSKDFMHLNSGTTNMEGIEICVSMGVSGREYCIALHVVV
jgi:hypothetical protein